MGSCLRALRCLPAPSAGRPSTAAASPPSRLATPRAHQGHEDALGDTQSSGYLEAPRGDDLCFAALFARQTAREEPHGGIAMGTPFKTRPSEKVSSVSC